MLFILGRFCLSLLFVIAIADIVLNWGVTRPQLIEIYSQWIDISSFPPYLDALFNWVLSQISWLIIVLVILAGFSGVFLLLGVQLRCSAWILIILMIPITCILHPFWLNETLLYQEQMILFLKNIAILGGLFLLVSKNSR